MVRATRRKKYIPSKRDLGKAWTIKKRGGTKKDICKRLGITMAVYQNNIDVFKMHYEQCKKKEKFNVEIKGVSKKAYKTKSPYMHKGETMLTIDNVDLEVLQSYIVCGFTREKIASLLGVSRGTLYKFINENPKVQRIVDNAIQDTMSDIVRNGLLRLCKQHKLPDMYIGNYKGDIVTKRITKHFNPNISAIKYVAANLLGWTSEPKPEKKNNKGTILRMLEEIHNGEDFSKIENESCKEE